MRIERSGFGLKMTSKLIEQAFEALNVARTSRRICTVRGAAY